MLRVMVVDDDSERRQILQQVLQQAGHQVVADVASTINMPNLVAKLLPDNL